MYILFVGVGNVALFLLLQIFFSIRFQQPIFYFVVLPYTLLYFLVTLVRTIILLTNLFFLSLSLIVSFSKSNLLSSIFLTSFSSFGAFPKTSTDISLSYIILAFTFSSLLLPACCSFFAILLSLFITALQHKKKVYLPGKRIQPLLIPLMLVFIGYLILFLLSFIIVYVWLHSDQDLFLVGLCSMFLSLFTFYFHPGEKKKNH